MNKVIELARYLPDPHPAYDDSPPPPVKDDIEVVWEEENSVGSINESAPKHSVLLSHAPSEQGWAYVSPSPPKKQHDYETGASDVAGNTVVFERLFHSKRVHSPNAVNRPCKHRRLFLQDLEMRPVQLSPNTRRRRDTMSSRAQERARKRSSNLAGAIQRRIAFEDCDSSSVGSQAGYGLQERILKVDSFIERQQFLSRQRQVLLEMRQFCEYGAIRLPPHRS